MFVFAVLSVFYSSLTLFSTRSLLLPTRRSCSTQCILTLSTNSCVFWEKSTGDLSFLPIYRLFLLEWRYQNDGPASAIFLRGAERRVLECYEVEVEVEAIMSRYARDQHTNSS